MANGDPLYYIWDAVKEIRSDVKAVLEWQEEHKLVHAAQDASTQVKRSWVSNVARWTGGVSASVVATLIITRVF